MADKRSAGADGASSVGQLIDSLCDRFEVAWRAGQRPQIEAYLASVAPEHRHRLLAELLILDVSYRQRAAENPRPDEYQQRFPSDDTVVASVFERLEGTRPSGAKSRRTAATTLDGESVSAATRYAQLQFHDEGGLGEVYRGHDEELNRDVAIKFIRADYVTNEEMRERFRIEAEVTGRLSHPGVVPVYSVGEGWDGRPFYTMRFIEGDTLLRAIDHYHATPEREHGRRSHRMELRRLLRHLVSTARTVAYAHNRGVLHRDIKPENIMLGKYDESLVVDWGLAQFIERDERARASGEKTLFPSALLDHQGFSDGGAGTIGYISPEQLPGSGQPVGPACDVYSLGATLYKLLTGQPAFRRRPGEDIWEQIYRGRFPRPRELNRSCPPPLEAICLKAMALRPADRYESAAAFATDLERWMADEPVEVYREPRFEQLLRFCRRNRAWTMAGGMVGTLLLLIASGASLFFQQQANRERGLLEQTRQAQRVAEEARHANLRSTALFAANAFGYEIDQRLRVLSEAAADPQLVDLIRAAGGKAVDGDEWKRLQSWLDGKSGKLVDSDRASSWFLTDQQGIQLARYPRKETIGESFRHRSYFHGQQRDYSETDANRLAQLTPTGRPCVSAVYASSGSKELKVAFSVPIRDPQARLDDPPLGVLGWSLDLKDILKIQLPRVSVALVDLRPDWLEEEEKNGLILDHPHLDAARYARAMTTGKDLVRLDQTLVKNLVGLREYRRRQRFYGDSVLRGDPAPQSLVRDYLDPASQLAVPCVAAFEPVFVPGRDPQLQDLGWVVVVQDLGPEKQAAH